MLLPVAVQPVADGFELADAEADAPVDVDAGAEGSLLEVTDGDEALQPLIANSTAQAAAPAHRWVIPPRPTTRAAYSRLMAVTRGCTLGS